jgi:hypothetical protein
MPPDTRRDDGGRAVDQALMPPGSENDLGMAESNTFQGCCSYGTMPRGSWGMEENIKRWITDGAIGLLGGLIAASYIASYTAAGIISMGLAVALLVFVFVLALGATFLLHHLHRFSWRQRAAIAILLSIALGLTGWYQWTHYSAPLTAEDVADKVWERLKTSPPESAPSIEISLECERAPLPEVGLPNQTSFFMIEPFRFTEEGTVGYAVSSSEPGKPFKWPDDWKNKTQSSARCQVTNYAKTTLFNIEIPFKIAFVRIKRGESPGSTVANEVINIAEGFVPITKLESGKAAAYNFYVHNQGRDFIRLQFADKGTCLPLGAENRAPVKVIQPSDIMHYVGAIWPIRDLGEILNEVEVSNSPPALPPPIPLPPSRQGKK